MSWTKLKWSTLFIDPANVIVNRTDDGRTFATDRYTVWDLDAVCAMFPDDVPPAPGKYKAMAAKGMVRLPSDGDLLNAAGLASLFAERTAGVTLKANGLRRAAWINDHGHRPLIDPRTGEVRMIDAGWLDSLPNFVIPAFTMSAANWKRFNIAVIGHGTRDGGTVPLACVQLIGSYNTPERPGALMCRALAASVGVEVSESPGQ